MHVAIVETSVTGAGRALLDVAEERGCELTLLASDPAAYPANCVDGYTRVRRCATGDWGALYAAADEINALYPLDGVTTVADLFVPQAAFLAGQFGLPGMPVRAACRARNKYWMRRRLADAAADLNPPFQLAHSVEDALRFFDKVDGPIIGKPQNANDSIAVRRLGSRAEIEHYFATLRAEVGVSAERWLADGILLEGFLDGPEFSVEIAKGKHGPFSIIGVSDKQLFGEEEGRFAEIGLSFPHDVPECALLEAGVVRALEALGIDCGVTHTECKLTPAGVKIVEVNPRLAGDMLGSHVIREATGRSALEAVLDTATGRFDGWRPLRSGGAAMYAVVARREGVFGGIANLDAVASKPGVRTVRMIAEPGDRVRPARDNGGVIAQIIAAAEDNRAAHVLARQAAEACELVIDCQSGRQDP